MFSIFSDVIYQSHQLNHGTNYGGNDTSNIQQYLLSFRNTFLIGITSKMRRRLYVLIHLKGKIATFAAAAPIKILSPDSTQYNKFIRKKGYQRNSFPLIPHFIVFINYQIFAKILFLCIDYLAKVRMFYFVKPLILLAFSFSQTPSDNQL